jgi:hypothetical protein
MFLSLSSVVVLGVGSWQKFSFVTFNCRCDALYYALMFCIHRREALTIWNWQRMTVLLTEVVAIAACQGKMLVVKAGSQLLPQQ